MQSMNPVYAQSPEVYGRLKGVHHVRNGTTWPCTQYTLGLLKPGIVCLFCLFGLSHPTLEFFSHLVTLPLPTKGCKFWPMLGTHGYWAMRVVYCAIPSLTLCILMSVAFGFEQLTFRLRGKRSSPPPRFPA